jgi:putative SOS response-associated peptidase YedK
MGYKVDKETFIKLKKIEKAFGTDAALELLRSGFEYDDWSVITATADKQDWEERRMHWEFIPNFVNSMDDLKLIRKGIDPKTGKRAIDPKTGKPKPIIPWLNAKAENLISSLMWRDAAKNRRCLVPATHFYEWRWYKPEGEKKEIAYPYLIKTIDPDSKLFYMAGIWNPWTDRKTGEHLETFAIVTASANGKMRQIHNKKLRQPTILPQELAERWLFDDLSDEEIVRIASYQWPSNKMYAHTLAKNFKELSDPIEHFKYDELPELIEVD